MTGETKGNKFRRLGRIKKRHNDETDMQIGGDAVCMKPGAWMNFIGNDMNACGVNEVRDGMWKNTNRNRAERRG